MTLVTINTHCWAEHNIFYYYYIHTYQDFPSLAKASSAGAGHPNSNIWCAVCISAWGSNAAVKNDTKFRWPKYFHSRNCEVKPYRRIKTLLIFFSFTSNLHYALFTVLTLRTTATVHKVLTLQWTKNLAILMDGHVNGWPY